MRQLSILLPLGCSVFFFFAQSCKENVDPVSVNSVTLNSNSALYNDMTGVYTVELEGDGTVLNIEFPVSFEGIALENPVPETGLYSIDASDTQYMLNVTWSDETGNIPVTEAMVSVMTENGMCVMDGTLFGSDESERLHFKTDQFSFEHTVGSFISADYAVSEYYDDGTFKVSLYGDGYDLNMSLVPQAVKDTLYVPEGEYRYSDGSIAAGSCVYTDSSGEHMTDDIWIGIVRKDGGSLLYGVIVFDDGTYARLYFKGTIYSADIFSGSIYLDLGGEWNMTTDRWLVYNADSEVWEYSDAGETYSMSMSGIPDYGCFLSSGLFDPSFSFLIYTDENGLFIPCGAASNPLAIVQSGSGSFYLFATLYDPETKYFMSGDKVVPLELAEDLSHFDVVACESEATENGEQIKINYTYFGLIGRKTTSITTYSMFSNWPFLRLPAFSRPGTDIPQSASSAVLNFDGTCENIKVSETIVDDGTLKIIPITNRQL